MDRNEAVQKLTDIGHIHIFSGALIKAHEELSDAVVGRLLHEHDDLHADVYSVGDEMDLDVTFGPESFVVTVPQLSRAFYVPATIPYSDLSDPVLDALVRVAEEAGPAGKSAGETPS